MNKVPGPIDDWLNSHPGIMSYGAVFAQNYFELHRQAGRPGAVFEVTFDHLRGIMKRGATVTAGSKHGPGTLAEMVSPLNMALAEFSINRNAKRVAGFLAQLAFESTELTQWSEDTSARDPVKHFDGKYSHNWRGIGNRGGHDGSDFRGRGPIQLTGRENYTRFGEWLNAQQPALFRNKLPKAALNRPHPADRDKHGKRLPDAADLTREQAAEMDANNPILLHPELVATDIYIGFLSAAWFCAASGNCNAICDKLTLNTSAPGERATFDLLSKAVNGPKCTSSSPRWSYYRRVLAVLFPPKPRRHPH